MQTLVESQRQFAALVLGCGEPLSLLRPAPGLATARIDVYRYAYRARLTEALRENFPILRLALGDEDFAALADAYIDAHPSRRPSIRWFGDALADFAAAQPDVLPHPALADLARMEWALSTAFDADDEPPLSVAALSQAPVSDWPQLWFSPHPSTRLLRLRWAVEPVWRALSADENAATSLPAENDHSLLIWRQGLQTQWRSVEAAEAVLLAACLAGESFADLCERAAASATDPAAAMAGYLRLWVEAGVLAAAR
ncbi:MAG: putative DNA-binding domain-containing protein [Betaproteobacteria bacterium]